MKLCQQIGEACREQVRHSIENARALLSETYDGAPTYLGWRPNPVAQVYAVCRGTLPAVRRGDARYCGRALGVPYDDVAGLYAMEAVTTDALHLTKCTSLGVNQSHTANQHVIIAHNEDWVPEDEPDVYMVHATPEDEPPFLAMSYGGLLPNIGINAKRDCTRLRHRLSKLTSALASRGWW